MIEEEVRDNPPSPRTLAREVVYAIAEVTVEVAQRGARVLVAVRDAWNSLGEWFHG